MVVLCSDDGGCNEASSQQLSDGATMLDPSAPALALRVRPCFSSTSWSLVVARSTCGCATPCTLAASGVKNERNLDEMPYSIGQRDNC